MNKIKNLKHKMFHKNHLYEITIFTFFEHFEIENN